MLVTYFLSENFWWGVAFFSILFIVSELGDKHLSKHFFENNDPPNNAPS